MDNIYLPEKARIEKIESLSLDTKLFRIKKSKKFLKDKNGLIFIPGQFILAGIWGYGEAPFGPSSSPYENSHIDLIIRNTGGNVTNAFFSSKEKDEITLRGPYGNGFPLDSFENKDVILIAGGSGIPPIASFIEYIIENRQKFGRVFLIYGAKTPEDLLLKDNLKKWQKKIDIILTVDKPANSWNGKVGFVSEFIKDMEVDFLNCEVAMCGPGPMMSASEKILKSLGVSDKKIFVNLERRMQCGVGKCQHCTVGDKYVCLDGSVFNYDQIDKSWD